MAIEIATTEYKPLDMNSVLKKPFKVISMDEALSDVVPVEWSEDVLNGRRKVYLDLIDVVIISKSDYEEMAKAQRNLEYMKKTDRSIKQLRSGGGQFHKLIEV